VALLVALSSTAFAFGNDPGMTVISANGSGLFKVIYQGATPGKVKLNIFDSEGKKIHAKIYSGLDGFICPLNFSRLTPGNYTIELVDGAGRYEQHIVYKPVHDVKGIHVTRLQGQEERY